MATQKNPVGWIEIPVKSLDRAKAFYEQLLAVQLTAQDVGDTKMAWFPMQRDGQGAAGSLVEAADYVPSDKGSLVYFSVDDIEKALERAKKGGGKVLSGKTSIGEYGFIAKLVDSEGNQVALHTPN